MGRFLAARGHVAPTPNHEQIRFQIRFYLNVETRQWMASSQKHINLALWLRNPEPKDITCATQGPKEAKKTLVQTVPHQKKVLIDGTDVIVDSLERALDERAKDSWWQVGCVCKRKISFVNRVVFSSKVDNGCHNVRYIA